MFHDFSVYETQSDFIRETIDTTMISHSQQAKLKTAHFIIQHSTKQTGGRLI